MKRARHFASDNNSGICPEAWAALEEANHGHASGYGEDQWTRKACRLIRDLFETDCDVFFIFTGSAANALGLASVCQSYHSIICHEASHVQNDECGAPEFFSGGAKVRTLTGKDGRLTPEAITAAVAKRRDLHFPKTGALSLTQSTELGTVYTPTQLKANCRAAKKSGLKIHMDGARFANAVSTLGVHPGDLTWRAGVDALSFGATKNGAMAAEAIVLFRTDVADDLAFRHKRAGQLLSKMRFIAAQLLAYIDDGLWLDLAGRANGKAQRLTDGFAAMSGAKLEGTGEANEVFVTLPGPVIDGLKAAGAQFYGWPEPWEATNTIRLVTRWDTTDGEVDDVLAQTSALLAQS